MSLAQRLHTALSRPFPIAKIEEAVQIAGEAYDGQRGGMLWRMYDGALYLRVQGAHMKNIMSPLGIPFSVKSDQDGNWWARVDPRDDLSPIAEVSKPFEWALENFGGIWARMSASHAAGKDRPEAKTSGSSSSALEGTYETTGSGYVKLFLDRGWGNRGNADAIMLARKDAAGRFYWLFKAKRATNLVAPALARGGFPNIAKKLADAFASIAESLEGSDGACNPLRDLAKATGPEDVTSPIGRAVVADVIETLKARLPVHVSLYGYQTVGVAFVKLNGYRALIGDSMGLGKAQPLSSKILTPGGWCRMGDMKVGDTVIDPDGGTAQVLGVFPQGVRDVFEVRTSDGGATRCCEEHLWLVQTPTDRSKNLPGQVLPLGEFGADLKKSDGRGWESRKWFLPLTKPASFASSTEELLFDPYVMGALLGDGGFTDNTPTISKPDAPLIERVRQHLPEGSVLSRKDQDTDDWRIVGVSVGRNPTTDALRAYGLMGLYSEQKFIPPVYLRSSVEGRLELLRGLMDTDGDCTKEGTATFNTSSPMLRDDVIELVRSLGGFSTTSVRKAPVYAYKGQKLIGREAYRVNVRLDVNPFWLERKAERWHEPNMARAIDEVVHVGREPVQCIKVSSKRHLYVTDDYIVTHNTPQAIATLAVDPEKLLPAVVVAPAIVFIHWQRELQKWLPNVPQYIMPNRNSEPPPKGFRGVVITKTSVLAWQADGLAAWGPRYVIVDEAHKFRNDDTEQSKALFTLAAAVPHVLLLSGTPFKNNLMELRVLLDLLDSEQFGKKADFGDRYTEVRDKDIGRGRTRKVYEGSRNEDELQYRLSCLMIRREKADVAKHLPPKVYRYIPIELEPKDRKEYNKADKEFGDWLKKEYERRLKEAIKEAGGGLSASEKRQLENEVEERVMRALKSEALTKLGQLRNLAGRLVVPYAIDYITQAVENGVPIIGFANFSDVLHPIVDGLRKAGVKVGVIDGAVPAPKRQEIADAFETKKLDVVLGSLAMIEGINLPRAEEVVQIERFWTPADEMQAEDRAHRANSKYERLLISYLHPENTVYDRIRDILAIKRTLMEKVLGTAKLEIGSTDLIGDVLADFLGKRGVSTAEKKTNPGARGKRGTYAIEKADVASLSFDASWSRRQAVQWMNVSGWEPRNIETIRGHVVATVGHAKKGKYRAVRIAEGVSAIIPR